MSLLRNSGINFLAGLLPSLVVLFTMPFVVHHLGTAHYGMLILVSSMIGYFAVIDINIAAAATKYVSEFRSKGDEASESAVITLAVVISACIGVIGSIAMFVAQDWLVEHALNLPPDQKELGLRCIRLAAVGFLVAQLQQVLQSLPQALQRYTWVGSSDAFFGVMVPGLTVLALMLGGGIYEVLLVRVTLSFCNVLVLALMARQLFPRWRYCWPTPALRRTVLSFSGYTYLGRLASLTYLHADKFIIGAMLSLEAVAYYSIAATIANRLLAMTFRFSSVIYPAASALAAQGRWDELKTAYFKTSRYVFFINSCAVALICLFAREILYYWMGADFAATGWIVLTVVSLAMLIDSASNLPSLVNDGVGHSRLTGLFAIGRALLGLAVVIPGAKLFGLDGVAYGHLVASTVVVVTFLFVVHRFSIPFSILAYARNTYPVALTVTALAMAASWFWHPGLVMPLSAVASLAFLLCATLAAVGWLKVLMPEDRVRVTNWIARRRGL